MEEQPRQGRILRAALAERPLAALPASTGLAGCPWESPGLGQSGFRRRFDAGVFVLFVFFFFSFTRHPLIENDPMQLSAWRPRASTHWTVPSAKILVVMTSSSYTQEDINNCLFAPDKKVLGSAALGSWRLAVFLVRRTRTHSACSQTRASPSLPSEGRDRLDRGGDSVIGVEKAPCRGFASQVIHRTLSGQNFIPEVELLGERAKTEPDLPFLGLSFSTDNTEITTVPLRLGRGKVSFEQGKKNKTNASCCCFNKEAMGFHSHFLNSTNHV